MLPLDPAALIVGLDEPSGLVTFAILPLGLGLPKRSLQIIRATEAQILVAAVAVFAVFSLLYPDSFFSIGTFMNMVVLSSLAPRLI